MSIVTILACGVFGVVAGFYSGAAIMDRVSFSNHGVRLLLLFLCLAVGVIISRAFLKNKSMRLFAGFPIGFAIIIAAMTAFEVLMTVTGGIKLSPGM